MQRTIKELKAYEHNPRKMGKEEFELLQSSLDEFGDLSGVIFNVKANNLIGGHQRTNHFKRSDSEIIITEEFNPPTRTGTTAQGYIVLDGEKYSYREVSWDNDKEQRANILANKVSGTWDFDKLANAFGSELLLATGWNEREIGFATSSEEDGIDTDTLSESMETYLSGNIKQIVLFFSSEEFEKIVPRLDKVMEMEGVSSHTEAFIKLLEKYEDNRSN